MRWNDERFICFDFETSGSKPEYALQPWRVAQGKAWATSLVWQFVRDGETHVCGGLNPSVADMRQMLEFAIAERRIVVGWNVQFDIQWLLAYGLRDLVFQCQWFDGMLFWRHFSIEPEYELARAKKKSYSLKACVAEVMPDEAGYEQDVDFHTSDPDKLAALHAYNVKDVAFTYTLAKMWFSRLTDAQQRAAVIESDCLPHVALANLRGLPVDLVAATELGAWLKRTAADKLAELTPHGVSEAVVRSPKKLGQLMFEHWKLTPLKKTATGADATDKETLHELAFVDERAKSVRAYREALNNKVKFADAPLESALYNGDGCAHPQAIVFGTYSGRLTYASKQRAREVSPKTGKERYVELKTGFALHQEKRAPEFRNIICAPQGYTLVEFDAAAQEFRWMAIASGDTTMLRLCQPGEDAHSYMGAAISGAEYQAMIAAVKAKDKAAKDVRQMGKIANLSLQYRTNAKRLRSVARVQYGMPMEMQEADHIHATYHRLYRGVQSYWERQIALTRQKGYVETFAGRRVQVHGDWSDNREAWAMGSTAINYRIQGTGADQKYLALASLGPLLEDFDAEFRWDLHDGLYFFAPADRAMAFAVAAKDTLDNLDYAGLWGFEPPIPLPWDCKMGGSWGTLEEVEF